MNKQTSHPTVVDTSAALNSEVLPSCYDNETIIGKRRQLCRGWLSRCFPRLRVVLSELRSLLPRIRMRFGKESSPLVVGRLFLESQRGHLLPNKRLHGRIECIKTVASKYQWTSPVDWRIAVGAWDQGVEWAVHNFGSCTSLPEEHKSLLASELSYRM